jgi:hypothetical protein
MFSASSSKDVCDASGMSASSPVARHVPESADPSGLATPSWGGAIRKYMIPAANRHILCDGGEVGIGGLAIGRGQQ